jgi:nitroreductase
MNNHPNHIRELVLRNRSTRRFSQDNPPTLATLRELVDIARQSPSAANLQPLRYVLSADPARNAGIFRHLRWAGYLEHWPGPGPEEQPTAYILLFADTRISPKVDCDHGIAAQTICLAAAEIGLAACMVGSVDREALVDLLGLGTDFRLLLVIALGRPGEAIVLENASTVGHIRYWRDENGVHHVPKRPLDEVILEI